MISFLRQHLGKLRLLILLGISSLATTSTNYAQAQIVPDNTLGAESTKLTPNTNIQGLPTTLIEGGATRGFNLFQSFLQFNVAEGQRVYFANPVGIENIFTRVTGSDISKIFGTLGVDGRANLYFLNPNGIIFGANARLDVTGSFLATTANSFVFDNGLKFSATNPEAAPLLTVTLLPGLQFAANSSGMIRNRGNLSVGQDLSLIADNLDLQGQLQANRDLTLIAQDTVNVRDTVSNPVIVAAGEKLTLQGNQSIDIFALNHPESGLFSGADMVLRSPNTIAGDASYWTGGNFRIEKLDGNLGNLFSPDNSIIRASGDVNFNSYQGASLHIFAGGAVNIDSIKIIGADKSNPANSIGENVPLAISLPNGTNSVAINGGKEPTLDIRAGTTAFTSPSLTPNPIPGVMGIVKTNAPSSSANINIGSITNLNYSPTGEPIKGKILLTNQYAANELPGNITTNLIQTFGDVTIDSRGDINSNGVIDISFGLDSNNNIQLLANQNINVIGSLLSDLENIVHGDGGNITLISKNGGIDTRFANIISITPQGVAGDVTIEASGDIYIGNIEASSNFNNLDSNYPGKLFSTINIKSINGSVYLNDSHLDTTNVGLGYAGDISISALQEVRVANDSIISSIGNIGQIYLGKSDYVDLSPQIVNIVDSRLNTDNPGEQGSAGNISITSVKDIAIANSKIYSNAPMSASRANAGSIFIESLGSLSLTNSQIVSDVLGGTGNAGSLRLDAGAISLQGTTLKTDNNGLGDGGSIEIHASKQDILIKNSQANSESNSLDNNISDPYLLPGYIHIAANQGSVILEETRLNTTNTAGGYAGYIFVNALNEILLNRNSGKEGTVQKGIISNGNSGNIFIGYSPDGESLIPKKVTLDNTFLTTSNLVQGTNQENILTKNAGNITVQSLGEFSLTSSNLETTTYGLGTGGSISIDANSLSLSNKSSLLANTLGTGKAGSVTVNTNGGAVSLSESSINTGSDDLIAKVTQDKSYQAGQGGGGDITINAAALFLSNNSILNANTFGAKNSGNIYIAVDKTVSFADSSIINASTYLQGNAGDVNIKAQEIYFSNESSIQAETFGSGKAGNIDITAQILSLNQTSRIDAQTFGSGNAGNVNIKTQSLALSDGARINGNTYGSGNGGTININPLDFIEKSAAVVTLSGASFLNGFSTGFFVNTESKQADAGAGGNITITTGNLTIKDGAVLSAPSKSSGSGGNIEINVNNLEITGGGQILTNAYSSGQAGSIKINATNNVAIAGQDFSYTQRLEELTQIIEVIKDTYDFVLPTSDREIRGILGPINQYSGLFANTEANSTGDGGTINIDPIQVTLKDEAKISVDSQGTGVAGSISITANRLTLDNRAAISADTDSGQGGSITLNLQDLLLFRRQSVISTTAGKQGAGGDGGAIAINLNTNNGFIVSPPAENNDISANAFSGSGGAIEINAKGVIGLATLTRLELEEKLGTTDPEKLDPQYLQTNDITAISQTDPQLNGIVSINSPEIDPSKSIISLPTNATDPSQQIAQSCGAGNQKIASTFTDTGRGGLPPKPDEFLSSDTVWEDVRLRANSPQPRLSTEAVKPTASQEKTVLTLPATGWVFNNKGEVTLISQTPQSSVAGFNSSNCAAK
ncbi:filamentous hemagglutinin N-terminal domain-containing protein [Tolypothrix sp. FACHB-123]|uniref:two-partner secretion domain-containing protein n=1 Tax=Tolypothrix sp. FACHB-123 TaxID=2692868 RepID=UPI001685E2B7|nr:filamentous hemagglutinin N-terminal domain-containing protein [Tolypothrix sp. FACHB-123]MBD2353611.1 filamentous hemagglutinin N-terminal domain-containing protein [Tolypothrix sp. FACHB-123]